MAETSSISAQARDHSANTKTIRRQGFVPCIIYGGEKTPEMISIDRRMILKNLEGGHFLSQIHEITVEGGEPQRTIARDIQFHPVKDHPIHADFMRVTANTKIHVAVPVKFINEETSPGLKGGGVLSIVRHEVEVVCRAADIPAELVCDLDGTELGDTLKFSSLGVPQGVKPAISERDFVVANISVPRAAAALEEEEGDVVEDTGGEDTEDTEE